MGFMPSESIPCLLRPNCASFKTIHKTFAAYCTAVLISLFISIAPSPTTATTRLEPDTAAPTQPVVKCPMDPHAALVLYLPGSLKRRCALHHVNEVPDSLITSASVCSTTIS